MTRLKLLLPACLPLLLAVACSSDSPVNQREDITVDSLANVAGTKGFYLLNEGNMGMNAASLDRYDCASGTYSRNIYADANPDVPKELGDVGNDLRIHGSRLYAVINCSNKVEVMDVATARRIGQIDIPNCRYIDFDGPYAYVTSYAGPVNIDPDYTQKGYVARVDTATLQVVDRCVVGFQPDGLAVAGNKIYVANSGGYMVPNYENTLSVISLDTFTATDTVQIAPNLQHVLADRHGALWVSSRGDYYGNPPRLYRYDIGQARVTHTFDMAAGSLWLDGDDLYVTGVSFSYETGDEIPTYAIIDTTNASVKRDCFLSQSVKSSIVKPYGLAVNPDTHDIILTDAGNYVSPGRVYCLSPEGDLRWSLRAGDIPAHIAFFK